MNNVVLGQDMKNLIFGSALTGLAVTTGIYMLQEYRAHEAELAAHERAMEPIEAALEEDRRCRSAMYDDLIANNINSKTIVNGLLAVKCDADLKNDVVHLQAYWELRNDYDFHLVEVSPHSAEGQRQMQWSIDYRRNGYSYETDDNA